MTASFLLLAALQTGAAADPAVPAPRPEYPFGVGERFTYTAKFGFITVGTGTIEVAGIDTVRQVPTFLFRFGIEGGVPMYRINSVLESRSAMTDLRSLRFTQHSEENGKLRERLYEIFPDSGYYREGENPEPMPSVARPLDDAAFLYFVRTQPLEVGRTYELHDYFKQDKNPLRIKVEKFEEMELPDGRKVQCFVIHPIIGDRGIFAPRQDARVWLTADAHRIPVQIRTRYPFGTISLRLKEMVLADPTPRPAEP